MSRAEQIKRIVDEHNMRVLNKHYARKSDTIGYGVEALIKGNVGTYTTRSNR